jgi:hypothetical protein
MLVVRPEFLFCTENVITRKDHRWRENARQIFTLGNPFQQFGGDDSQDVGKSNDGIERCRIVSIFNLRRTKIFAADHFVVPREGFFSRRT